MSTLRRVVKGTAKATVLALVVVLAACSKSGGKVVPTPSPSLPVPSAPAVTTTATVTPSHSPTPTPTKTVTPRATVTPTATPSVTPTVEVSEASGATKTIKAGQFTSLRLPESTDGGFRWVFQTTPDPAILAVLSDQSLAPTNVPTGTVGASGTHKWVFQAKAPGTTTFSVIEQGPGSPAATASRYSLMVVVSP